MNKPPHYTFLIVNDLYRLYANQRSTVWCQRVYKRIKRANGLTRPEQLLTVHMYCDYMMLDINEVSRYMGWAEYDTTGPVYKKAA